MKKLVLSTIVGLSLASATSVGFGTGYLDGKYKPIFLKLNTNVDFLGFGATIATDYLKGFVHNKFNINNVNNIAIATKQNIGLEKYKIENKNEIQAFLGYNILFTKYKNLITKETNIFPQILTEIGTKSTIIGAGVIIKFNNKLNAEYSFKRRFLYKKVENTKATNSATISFNYLF